VLLCYCVPPFVTKVCVACVQVIVPKRTALLLDRIMAALQKAVEDDKGGQKFAPDLTENKVRNYVTCRQCLKCDGTLAETRFRLSAKRTRPFKSAGGVGSVDYLAAEVCASAVVMLDTPCSEVV